MEQHLKSKNKVKKDRSAIILSLAPQRTSEEIQATLNLIYQEDEIQLKCQLFCFQKKLLKT